LDSFGFLGGGGGRRIKKGINLNINLEDNDQLITNKQAGRFLVGQATTTTSQRQLLCLF